jgi:hypothetical protein
LERVAVDSGISHTFWPVHTKQTRCPVTLLSTKQRNPKFGDDAGVEQNFGFEVEVGELPLRQRSLELKMKFGATSIAVAAFRKNLVREQPVQVKVIRFEKRFANTQTY